MNRLTLALGVTGGAHAADCDRACLKGMITKYVDAVVAHDPSRLPLGAGVRFTEDSKELKLGEGLWIARGSHHEGFALQAGFV
jgi:hypothetical protein